ncbi:hypothetical protein R3P38DRAFT_3209243 [Favolaschia claudopus]|uniref:Uncharacterized protein n=1 Tax=Favolaschia claudopus TaxID=2862362 RepID=A0AAW0AKR3_9AGAR
MKRASRHCAPTDQRRGFAPARSANPGHNISKFTLIDGRLIYKNPIYAWGGFFERSFRRDQERRRRGEAIPYCIPSYSADDITSAFTSISAQFPNSHYALRAALFNVGYAVWKPFLEVTASEVQESLNTNVAAAFAFSRSAILKFKENKLDAENPKRGTLIFKGATASTRGNKMTSAFSIGKFGARALSQSLAKEFGKDGIHVAHAIIDGQIMTGAALERSRDQPLSGLSPESIAQAYMYLVNQEKSAWTWELDRSSVRLPLNDCQCMLASNRLINFLASLPYLAVLLSSHLDRSFTPFPIRMPISFSSIRLPFTPLRARPATLSTTPICPSSLTPIVTRA